MNSHPIAVFDSGVGGISVLRELTRLMPCESYLYFGDSANAPYGSRTEDEVRSLTERHAAHLLSLGAKAIVIACNTATGAAISSLRKTYPHVPILGIEPAVKPAALQHPGGRILVMATPVTLETDKFRQLLSAYQNTAELIPVPCRNLAYMIESGQIEGPELEQYLNDTLSPHLLKPADAVVLGCTHYPFVRDAIARMAKTDAIYDGGPGTARQTQRILAASDALTDSRTRGSVTILNSDENETRLQLCRRLLQI